ncbi:MAG: 5,6-dimethylbenzimidazole synthase [Oceanospirillaceae bacterium]|jgi:5,6-dimethylbenzimidazole synthase
MKKFNHQDCETLEQIMLHRRDVRGNRFLAKEIPQSALDKILFAAINAPSVGFSQPWEFVIIKDKKRKQAIKETFVAANINEKQQFDDAKQSQYAALKLEGIHEAPLNIAVFYTPSKQPVLGQTNMPEVGPYSVVCAVQNMWLMARALNIGLGWVSILDPQRVKQIVNAPAENQLVAYLCLGYVDQFYASPELEQKKWQARKDFSSLVIDESYA